MLNLVNKFSPKILSEEEMIAAIDYGKGTGGSGRFWTLDPIGILYITIILILEMVRKDFYVVDNMLYV